MDRIIRRPVELIISQYEARMLIDCIDNAEKDVGNEDAAAYSLTKQELRELRERVLGGGRKVGFFTG
jgi:hypothetical protein